MNDLSHFGSVPDDEEVVSATETPVEKVEEPQPVTQLTEAEPTPTPAPEIPEEPKPTTPPSDIHYFEAPDKLMSDVEVKWVSSKDEMVEPTKTEEPPVTEKVETVEATENVTETGPIQAKLNWSQSYSIHMSDEVKGYPIPLPSFNVKTLYDHEADKVFNSRIENKPEFANDVKESMMLNFGAVSEYNGVLDEYQSDLVNKGDKYWVQEVQGSRNKLRAGRPLFQDTPENRLTGRDASMRIRSLMGMSSVFTVPLWHTGIWVTIESPTDSDLVNYEFLLDRQKVEIGRSTIGYVFSNDGVINAKLLTELFLRKVVSTSLQGSDEMDLSDIIKSNDIHTMVWAMAAALYPKGYPYKRSIINANPDGPDTVTGMVDVGKMFWVDKHSLTESQVLHMEKRSTGSMTLDDVERYQSEFRNHRYANQVVQTNEETGRSISFILKIPTLKEHFNEGMRWLNIVKRGLEIALKDQDDEEARKALLTSYVSTNILGRFTHYVDYIKYTNKNGEEEDYHEREFIDNLIEQYSSSRKMAVTVEKIFLEFIDNVTVSVIATPTVNDTEKGILERFPSLVVIDPVAAFFIMVSVRNVTD